ncbi:alkyl hydroperoxide reductase [Elizabethkingia anophelis]|uniref:alkyl hydroperoxide reductase n=1 Tax=Elizabethkingia anophelis TaxID=1117645 RepID=UPI002012DF53|nr:alkyl hydroperoxide reductase [Elizabethkingia anophelis]MCL1689398.1 alkyl hydroperoxide reductase [Elizabethkingia anophelis]MDV4009473.1 alkyl hydroperoxide reductase [Elizabethkingia anophelis]
MRFYIFLIFVMFSISLKSQEIRMDFPKFSGKHYDFILFQGGEQRTVFQGEIPLDGKFTLNIPEEYKPYVGMSRWLITGTREGGGLDMFIPGHDFSVSCLSSMPSDDNIVYENNPGNKELNRLYQEKETIIKRYNIMHEALLSFDKKDSNYSIFQKESQLQQRSFVEYQKSLDLRKDYISEFIRIVSITMGVGTKLVDKEWDRAENINHYITRDINWNYVYTSGHWDSVISSWVTLHTEVLKDTSGFRRDYKRIISRILKEAYLEEFKSSVLKILEEEKKIDFERVIKEDYDMDKNKVSKKETFEIPQAV